MACDPSVIVDPCVFGFFCLLLRKDWLTTPEEQWGQSIPGLRNEDAQDRGVLLGGKSCPFLGSRSCRQGGGS
jgi:hypothetical protein